MATEKLGIEIETLLKEVRSVKELARDMKKIQKNTGQADQQMAKFQRRMMRMREVRESFQSLNIAGMQMMAISGGILMGVKKFGKAFVDSAQEMQQYELTLITLFKDEKKALEELAWAKKFAMGTPFALKDIIWAQTIFKSFGLDAKEYLGLAGDMAAAFGGDTEKFRSAIMGVSKAAATGAGAMDVLRESYGITGEQLRKFGWKGKGDIEGFRIALKTLLAERFGGGMERLAKTFRGIRTNISDIIWSFRADVGKPILGVLEKDFGNLLETIKRLKKEGKLAEWGKIIQDMFLGIYSVIKQTIGVLGVILFHLLRFLSKHTDLSKFIGKVFLIGTAFTFIAGAVAMFTGLIGQSITSLIMLRIHLMSLSPLLGTTVGLLGKIGAVGVAAFAGWQIGRLLGQLKMGSKTLDEWVQHLYRITMFKDLLQKEKLGTKTGRLTREYELLQAAKEIKVVIEKEGLEGLVGRKAMAYFEVIGAGKIPKTAEDAIKKLSIRIKTLERMTAIKELGPFPAPGAKELTFANKVKKELAALRSQFPGVLGAPTPESVGMPTPATITATRPEINNYYYTTHFERDSVQINTARLSPEKFLTLLEEVIRRKALVNEPT